MRATGHTVIASPVGDLTVAAVDGALTGLYLPGQRHRPADAALGPRLTGGFEAVAEQLGEYFAGRRQAFDLPLAPTGTAFQLQVWAALREIPYGRTWSYGRLAEHLGRPGAARAVGLANGRNPISIVVPCHRVVGAGGALTGYSGGIERKEQLLRLESGIPDRIGRSGADERPRAGVPLEA